MHYALTCYLKIIEEVLGPWPPPCVCVWEGGGRDGAVQQWQCIRKQETFALPVQSLWFAPFPLHSSLLICTMHVICTICLRGPCKCASKWLLRYGEIAEWRRAESGCTSFSTILYYYWGCILTQRDPCFVESRNWPTVTSSDIVEEMPHNNVQLSTSTNWFTYITTFYPSEYPWTLSPGDNPPCPLPSLPDLAWELGVGIPSRWRQQLIIHKGAGQILLCSYFPQGGAEPSKSATYLWQKYFRKGEKIHKVVLGQLGVPTWDPTMYSLELYPDPTILSARPCRLLPSRPKSTFAHRHMCAEACRHTAPARV